ncbi:MAG: hypothetical protein AB7K71_41315 [Polyangiaceae bacterium]
MLRPVLVMRQLTIGLFGLAGLVAATSCTTDPPNRGCQRLVDFSCGCFPECREQDTAVINDQDRDACQQRLDEHFQSWRHCEFDCRGDCQYGWGVCAFEIYRNVGLDPQGICDGSDAGADASGDGGDATADAAGSSDGG